MFINIINSKTKLNRKSDYVMVRKKLPAQAIDAIAVYDKVAMEYPDMEISVTGHSLSGSLGEIVSGIRGGLYGDI